MKSQSLTVFKYHCLENDFLLVESKVDTLHKRQIGVLAVRLCHRHKGIGADGLLWLRTSRKRGVHARLDIFNQDGSWAERSGNGQRIAGVHLVRKRQSGRSELLFESGSGVARVFVQKSGKSVTATAFLPAPNFRPSSLPMRTSSKTIVGKIIQFGKHRLRVTCLSVGNPHVIVHAQKELTHWQEIGRQIERDPRFPRRTNVEFVRVIDRSHLDAQVWERGAGATGSSGTGGGASLAAMVAHGETRRSVEIRFPAGIMKVSWPSDIEEIATTAPVHFIGQFEITI